MTASGTGGGCNGTIDELAGGKGGGSAMGGDTVRNTAARCGGMIYGSATAARYGGALRRHDMTAAPWLDTAA